MKKISRAEKIIKFLKEYFVSPIQCFYTRNTVGDYMYNIYNEDNVKIDYAPDYNYIEIFGLTKDEYNAIVKEVSQGRVSAIWED